MVGAVLAALLAVQVQDTSTYKDGSTARLIAEARARHRFQDTLVHDYSAMIRTRVDAGLGRSRFARILPFIAMETAAAITWARPNDLKIKVLGARSASTIRGAKVEGTFSDPWFVPRGLGDSIRFIDQEITENPALHPLAPGGPDYYRYAIFDSVSLELPGHRVSAIGVRVEPKRLGPALIAGNMWLDAETHEVVRMTFTFLGEFLWDTPAKETAKDSADARKGNRIANRIINVDLEMEYALHQGKYWMPYRQLVTLTVDIPWFLNATIPVHFITTFSDYRINEGAAPVFTVAPRDTADRRRRRCRGQATDSTCVEQRENQRRSSEGYTRAEFWDGGRWELEAPPRDSLEVFEWGDKLVLEPDGATEQLIHETAATLAKLERSLPAEWIGRQTAGLVFERFSDIMRFNRVQGFSFGAGYRVLQSGFNSLLVSGRYGISDHRATGALTMRRDGPGGRLDIGAWRTFRETDPWTRGASFGNTMNAMFAGHDDAGYFLAMGGGGEFQGNTGLLRDWDVSARFERVRSVSVRARSGLNDLLGGSGIFPPNPPILDGDFVGASAHRPKSLGPVNVEAGLDALAGVGGAGQGRTGARLWGTGRLRFNLAGRGGTVTLRGGVNAGDSLPQLFLAVGGPETVRGYGYGTRSGRSMWSGQFDFTLGTRSVITPVIFADVGNVGGSPFDPLASVGGGVSLLSGMIRFNLAKGLSPKSGLRFDLLFRAPR